MTVKLRPTRNDLGAVKISESIDIEGLLAQIPRVLQKESVGDREAALKKGVRAAANIVRADYRKRVPKGKTGNLKKSIITKVIPYRDGSLWFGIAGPQWGIGNHAHLIERGHKVYARGPIGNSAHKLNIQPLTGSARTEARNDLLKAVDSTATRQDAAFVNAIVKEIKKAGG